MYKQVVAAIKPEKIKRGKCRGCGGHSYLIQCKEKHGNARPWLCYDCALYASEGDI